MSSSDHPESGVSEPNEHELGATTPSPQGLTQPTPNTAKREPPTAPNKSIPAVDSSAAAALSSASTLAQPGGAATANHPATGGESTGPVTTTNISTTTPSADTKASFPQHSPDLATMEMEEPKVPGALSEEQTEDVDGKEGEDAGPSLAITLLLTTGARHPFTIDGKYLRKRSVNVENHDPFAMSVYTLKELIWREWRSDWETRPTSPTSIRLISFGKLLDDKAPLAESKFSRDHPNVVHMTVKPQEVVDEEDAKGAKSQFGHGRDASDRSPGCRCVIL